MQNCNGSPVRANGRGQRVSRLLSLGSTCRSGGNSQSNLLKSAVNSILLLSLTLGAGLLLEPGFNYASAAEQAPKVYQFSGNTIADIAEKAMPAVVHLEMRHKITAGTAGLPPGMDFFFNGQRVPINRFLGQQQEDEDSPKADSGKPTPPEQLSVKPDIASGFIIRADGYIVTNAHAVDNQDAIKVTLADKRSFDAKVVGIDQFSDLAVVKVDAKDLPTIPWGSSSTLRPGEFAIAIGSPLGDDHTVTMGIISAVGRAESDVNGNINFIQTDAAINPGNSGGPLLNLSGEVVGVNTAIRKYAQNIAYSIPADIAKTVSGEIIDKGKIDRPWLGIQMSELDEAYIKGMNMPPETKGVLIKGFVQGSPGQASGLKLNDVIQKINGKDMRIPKDVKEYVQSRKSGEILNFICLRNGQVQAVQVNVGSYPRNFNSRVH